MAHDAMTQTAVNASVFSSYKSIKKYYYKANGKINSNMCDKSTDKFVWNKRMNKFVECSVCKQY